MENEDILEHVLDTAGEEFDPEDDPRQIPHTRAVVGKFFRLHPKAIVYRTHRDGTFIGWSAAVPTSRDLAQAFLAGQISERELFEQTEPTMELEAVYLSGVVVKEAYRRRGYGTDMLTEQIQAFRNERYDIMFFTWAITGNGRRLIERVKHDLGVTIHELKEKK